MKQATIVLFFQLCTWSVFAQSFQGFYTGQLKLSDAGIKMSVQMDLMQDSGMVSAVLRFRAIDDNQLSGCDNWLSGQKAGSKIRLQNLVSLKETNIPSWVCNDFEWLDISPAKMSTASTPEFKGNLTDKTGRNFGTVTFTRVDTVLSFSVSEERAEAMYRLSEMQIAMTLADSSRVGLMLVNRGVQILDSLEIPLGNASIKVEAPTADRFNKLTLLINDNIALLNTAPAQKGSIIRLQEMEEGTFDIIMIGYHVLVDVNYFVTLTLTFEGGEKVWEIPVSTYKNRAIRVKMKQKT